MSVRRFARILPRCAHAPSAVQLEMQSVPLGVASKNFSTTLCSRGVWLTSIFKYSHTLQRVNMLTLLHTASHGQSRRQPSKKVVTSASGTSVRRSLGCARACVLAAVPESPLQADKSANRSLGCAKAYALARFRGRCATASVAFSSVKFYLSRMSLR